MTKKILLVFVVVLAVVMVIMNPFSVAPLEEAFPTSMAVQLPEAINVAIAVGLAALLAMGAAYIFEKTGLDLREYTAPISITLGAWVASELQNIINTIPEAYDPTLNIVLKIIVLLVAPVGLLALRVRPVPPGRLI